MLRRMTTGRRDASAAWAPGRVNLIGEHTDYNGGPVLPVPLELGTTATLRRRSDDRVRLRSRQERTTWEGGVADLLPGALPGWTAYVGGVLGALRERGVLLPGLDVEVDGDVPLGAGLSSSASVTCAVAVAAADLLGLPTDDVGRRDLVAVCMRAEAAYAGAPTGGMDQTVALLARPGAALRIDFGLDPPAVRAVPLPSPDRVALLVVDTGVRHALADGGYAERREVCARVAAELGLAALAQADLRAVDALPDELRGPVRHVVTEVARVAEVEAALAADDQAAVGRALLASHASLRDDFVVSCPELDAAVEAAVAAGAWGGRLTGGGFGGSVLVWAAPAVADRVGDAVAAVYAERGWPAPVVRRVRPGRPAAPR